jgi:glycolate oxidase FAD binding subunit
MDSGPGTRGVDVQVIEPSSVDEVAATLARASRDKRRVGIQGAGTKLGWGPPRAAIDLVLSMARLNAIVAHRHADLTATVQAGATLAAVNRQLARHGQWIPLDPPWADRATIGGIVATNDSGPRRHRYGAPRDLIIGIEIVRADGVLAKAGGIVVKNVAGYDLTRLMTGSFGSLAVVVAATFKLFPLPQASRTVVIDVADTLPPAGTTSAERVALEQLGSLAAALRASQMTPTALELQAPSPVRLLVRFESIEAAADQQAEQTARLAESNGARAAVLSKTGETRVWEAHGRHLWESPGAVIKLTLLPGELTSTLEWLTGAVSGADWELVGRLGVGVLLLRVNGDAATEARLVSDLRARLPRERGSAVLVRASDELKASVGVWGPMGDSLALMQAVKQQFDPDRILNPGLGPGGL